MKRQRPSTKCQLDSADRLCRSLCAIRAGFPGNLPEDLRGESSDYIRGALTALNWVLGKDLTDPAYPAGHPQPKPAQAEIREERLLPQRY